MDGPRWLRTTATDAVDDDSIAVPRPIVTRARSPFRSIGNLVSGSPSGRKAGYVGAAVFHRELVEFVERVSRRERAL